MRFSAALMLSLAGPALAGEISLSTPIDCALGEDRPCYIQNYVDRDPSNRHRDFTCNGLSYDTHKGTDFALRTRADVALNVPILAAADGIVKGTRDGMIDQVYTPAEEERVRGRECGNGMVIDHGDGWETQYCHLKRGSVAVRSGDRVTAGQTLGFVGMSGKAAFPHLHLSVRHNGQVIDPFAPNPTTQCSTKPQDPLWADQLLYQPGGLLDVGFATGVPDYESIKSGAAHTATLTSTAPALVLWGFAFGSQAGDVLRLRITAPNGQEVFASDQTVERAQAQFFRAAGRRTNGAAWFETGTYTGTVDMLRDGETISDMTITTTVTR